jgi:RNA polymerase sigma-70 factor (ECF subfamily)
MKIKYQFVTGEVTEVEISEEIGAVIIDLDRQEYNNDHKETRRHESLYKTEEYGDRYAADDDTEGEVIAREGAAEQEEQFRKLHHAIKKLTPDQQDLVNKVILGGMTITAYAKQIGISQPAATQRRQTIMKKLKKFF